MEKIKELRKNQKKMIEGLAVCFIGGWAFSSIISGSFKEIGNLEYCGEINFAITILMLVLASAAMAGVYMLHDHLARLLMFGLVYLYLILCATNGYGMNWEEKTKNPIGLACFTGVLCLAAVFAFYYVKEDIFKLFKKTKINRKNANALVVVTGVLLFAFVGGVTVLRYLTYSNSTFDFGVFAQMFEHMKQTGKINTTVESNVLFSHFGRHFSPIFYIALPVYFVFSSPVTVQLIQALMVALPVIPILLLCRHYKMSHWMCVAVTVLYALYPATAAGTFYDIHENCFLTFVLLMAIWAVETNRNVLTVIFIVLTLFVKEDAAIYVLALGAYYLFSKRYKKKGILLMAVSVLYFVLALHIVDSFGGRALNINNAIFRNLRFDAEGGMLQILRTIIVNPAYVFGQVAANYSLDDMDKIEYLIYMLVPMVPVIFTAGKKYARYLLLTPFLIMNVFTSYVYLHAIGWQYNFGTIALMMYLLIMNLSDLNVKKAKTRIGVAVLCAGVMFMGAVCPKLGHYTEKYKENKTIYSQMNQGLDLIPDNASVAASGFLVPHLSNHLELYDQNHLETDVYTEYLAVDCRYSEEEKFDNILASNQYELIYSVEGAIKIYRKK